MWHQLLYSLICFLFEYWKISLIKYAYIWHIIFKILSVLLCSIKCSQVVVQPSPPPIPRILSSYQIEIPYPLNTNSLLFKCFLELIYIVRNMYLMMIIIVIFSLSFNKWIVEFRNIIQEYHTDQSERWIDSCCKWNFNLDFLNTEWLLCEWDWSFWVPYSNVPKDNTCYGKIIAIVYYFPIYIFGFHSIFF